MQRTKFIANLARTMAVRPRATPLRVGIDGIDASGKTMLADELATALREMRVAVIRASVDGFHNPRAVRLRQGSLSPDGYYADSYNYAALTTLLLDPLSAGGTRQYRTACFDARTDSAVDAPLLTAPDDAILVFDGIFLQRAELEHYWDVRLFVDVPFEVALDRAVQRDLALFSSAEVVRERYLTRYFPAQRRYLAEQKPRERADIVIDNREPSAPTVSQGLG